MKYVILFIIFLLLVGGVVFLFFNLFSNQPPSTPPASAPINNGGNTGGNTGGNNGGNTGGSNGGNTGGSNSNNGGTGTPPILNTPENLAESITPNSGNYSTGQLVDITLNATPPAGATRVNIRLEVVGAQIVNFIEPLSGWQSIVAGPSCTQKFSAGLVCVTLTKSAGVTITRGETLGTVRVRVIDPSAFSLRYVSGTSYIVGNQTIPFTGMAGNFNGNGSLPQTALISDEVDRLLLAFAAIVMALLVHRFGLVQKATLAFTANTGLGWDAYAADDRGIKGIIQRMHLSGIRSHREFSRKRSK